MTHCDATPIHAPIPVKLIAPPLAECSGIVASPLPRMLLHHASSHSLTSFVHHPTGMSVFPSFQSIKCDQMNSNHGCFSLMLLGLMLPILIDAACICTPWGLISLSLTNELLTKGSGCAWKSRANMNRVGLKHGHSKKHEPSVAVGNMLALEANHFSTPAFQVL